jgi:hypothetical protein
LSLGTGQTRLHTSRNMDEKQKDLDEVLQQERPARVQAD